LYRDDGVTPLTAAVESSAGDGSGGQATFTFDAVEIAAIALSRVLLLVTVEDGGDTYSWEWLYDVVRPSFPPSVLFPNREDALTDIRARLARLPGGVGAYTDGELWTKLIAAEREIQRRLRVFFGATRVLPGDAPASEVQALIDAGTQYATEAAYDYAPNEYMGDAWGFIQLRQKPVLSMESLQFAYPNPGNLIYDVPLDWIRLDRKYAQLHIVPTGMTSLAPVSGYMLSSIAGGRNIPMMVRARYVAGLTPGHECWPDLLDIVLRMVSQRVLQDMFIPESGSIAADGLSSSISLNIEQQIMANERALANLYESLHGPRLAVF
jgi:hypothetical protein